jgi:hypothetical protein
MRSSESELRVLGDTEVGPRQAVALGTAGGRFHTHVIGATGAGKWLSCCFRGRCELLKGEQHRLVSTFSVGSRR